MKPSIRQAAVDHLRTVDPVMAAWIDEAGPCALTRRQNRFEALVRAILAQQVSASVAKVFRERVAALCAPDPLSPEALLRVTPAQLRAAGCSRAKAEYLLDLAEKVHTGVLPLNQLGRLSDDGVIEKLIAVKGIGVWTAQMFLIFSLGRPDVFPHGDLAVRAGIQKIYGMRTLPSKSRMQRIAEQWSPYASIGAWYCWRWHHLRGAHKPKQ